ncbi:protein homooligomerization [Seminavis robusta]|uniref:Protein homooligomerization n=1 Tax=Seminavis robusta TaxID=568900 RepID=A0A9N8HIG0_9STRA|nr:protein homooligomerization [Seminavis robusta]|eukprot:Sro781_g201560.1 protein homooligomerization (281) ;mRNA; f:21131-21973
MSFVGRALAATSSRTIPVARAGNRPLAFASQPRSSQRRLFSSESPTTKTVAAESPSSTVAQLQSNNGNSDLLARHNNVVVINNIPRHGKGDKVLTLNVGGKEFCTLRSTVASNRILAEHVARAEANQEFTHGGSAVFIDRDPQHFQLILNHLRNKVEGLSYSSKKKISYKSSYVQLPKDIKELRDIYVEATHYQIKELQAASCEQNAIVTIIGALGGGGGNPFDQSARLLQQVRRGFVALGGISTVAIGSQQTDLNSILSSLFPAWFPPKDKDADTPVVA